MRQAEALKLYSEAHQRLENARKIQFDESWPLSPELARVMLEFERLVDFIAEMIGSN